MNKLLAAMFVALLMVGCGEPDLSDPDVVENATADAVDWSKLQDRNGVKYLPNEDTPFTGRAESFYENGQKKREENYKDGKRERLITKWHKNGNKLSELNYKAGKKDGVGSGWYSNGRKSWEGNFKDGKWDGLQKKWFENGNKREQTSWRDGINHGLSIWYGIDGAEWLRATYKNGERVE